MCRLLYPVREPRKLCLGQELRHELAGSDPSWGGSGPPGASIYNIWRPPHVRLTSCLTRISPGHPLDVATGSEPEAAVRLRIQFFRADRGPVTENSDGSNLSPRTFTSHEVKDTAELAVGVSSARFEFDCGRRRHLLGIAGV